MSLEAREASRGSAVRLTAEVLSRVLTFAATILMARHLPITAFGSFAVQMSLASILAEAGDLGLQALAARALVASQFSLRDFLKARGLLLVGCVVPVLAVAVARPVLGLLIVYFLLANWTEFLGVTLRARRAPVAEGLLLFALRAFGLLAVAAALTLGEPGLSSLAWAFVLSAVPAVALGFALLRGTRGPSAAASRGARAVLSAAFPLGVNGPLALLSPKVELLALPLLRGAFDAGLYAGALRLVEPLLAIPSAIVAGALPSLTREAVGGGEAVRWRTARTVAVLAVPAAIGLSIVAPGVIQFLGSSFTPAGGALRILALAVLPLFLNTLLLQSLIAAGHSRLVPWLTGFRVVVAATLGLLLLPRYGPVGAAAGFLGSELLLSIAAAAACRRGGFPVPVGRPLAEAVLLATPMTFAIAAAGWRLPVAGTIALGVVVFSATLVWRWRRDRPLR